jgi:hypothetical protein
MVEPLGGETVRRPLLVRTVLEVVRDAGRPLPPGQAVAAVASRVDLTPAELSVNDSGIPRWETFVRWVSSWAKTVGWMSKQGGWSLTEAGAEAVDTYGDGLYKELTRRYRLRYKAKKTGDQLRDKLVTFLTLVEEGSWTSVSDLAGALDLPDSELRDILRWADLPNAHRVLTRDGRVLADESQDIDRLHAELVGEGVEFDAEGRASQAQRLSAENLLELSQHADDEPGARRAWLVRGSNVDGRDLVPEWLAEDAEQPDDWEGALQRVDVAGRLQRARVNGRLSRHTRAAGAGPEAGALEGAQQLPGPWVEEAQRVRVDADADPAAEDVRGQDEVLAQRHAESWRGRWSVVETEIERRCARSRRISSVGRVRVRVDSGIAAG